MNLSGGSSGEMFHLLSLRSGQGLAFGGDWEAPPHPQPAECSFLSSSSCLSPALHSLVSASGETGTHAPLGCFSPGVLLYSSASQPQHYCHLGLHISLMVGVGLPCVGGRVKDGVESVPCIAGGLAASLASSTH